MNNTFNEEITNYNEIDHTNVNFVDDSNSVVTFHDPTDANHYLATFFTTILSCNSKSITIKHVFW